MRKKIFAFLMVMAIAFTSASCGEPTENSSQPMTDDPNLFNGTFFSMPRLDNAVFNQSGNDYIMTNADGVISIRILPQPGLTPEDSERTRSLLDAFAKGLIDITVDPTQIDGRKALSLSGKKDDLTYKYIAIALSDAACIISNEPINQNNTPIFEKIVSTFKLTNENYFKGFDFSSVPGNSSIKETLPNKPVVYNNDLFSFNVPQGWEVSTTDNQSFMVTPSDGNATDFMQGITIDVTPKHNKESDLAYARGFGSKPSTVTYGKNVYAQFFIASINTHNFFITKGDKTYFITITSNTEKLSTKMTDFLNSLVFK